MSATEVKSGKVTAATSEGKDEVPGTSTIVAVIPSNATENVVTMLKNTSSGNSSAESAESQEILDASDLTRDQWIKVLTSSSVLKAWKAQIEGGKVHVNRAPCAALALKVESPDSCEGEVAFPEFEIADDTYVDSRESRNRLERELTLKAFSENDIRAGLSGGTADIGVGVGGGVSWLKEKSTSDQKQTSNTTIHGFYNFPKVILHLHPDYLDLSPQCKLFFKRYGPDCLDWDKIEATHSMFADRFGTFLFGRLTLGARLCTTQELKTNNQTNISEARKDLEFDLTAKVTGATVGIESGYHRKAGSTQGDSQSEMAESTRLTLKTQGGNGLLASSIPDWTASVASHRYWRTIQQEQYWDLPKFLADLALDAVMHEQIFSLAEYNDLIKRNLSKLLIWASAEGETKWPSVSGVDNSPRHFKIKLLTNIPNAIRSIQVSQYPWQRLPGKLESSRPPVIASFERKDMQNGCYFNVTFDYSSPQMIGPPSSPMHVPADDLFIAVEVQPFMKLQGNAPHSVGDDCFEILQWRTVPINVGQRWEFSVNHKNQIPEKGSSLFSPSENPEPTPKVENDGKFLNLPSNRTDAPEAKRSNSMKGLKKKMHLGSD